jgi:cullin 1
MYQQRNQWYILITPLVEAGQGLYRRLSEFLTHHLRDTLNDLQVYEGDTLLEVYLNTKDKFHKAAKRVDILFRSLNQHWVKRSVEEGKQGIYDVRILHFVKWRSDLWEKVSDRLIDFTQEDLESQSHEEMGDSVNSRLVQPLTALHLADSLSHDIRQDIRYGLEKPFEKEIQAFNNQISKWVRQEAQRLPVTASTDTQVHQHAED